MPISSTSTPTSPSSRPPSDDYWHGRLTPSLTAIIGLSGTYCLPVGVTYRHSDSLLFDFRYVWLGGAFTFPTGLFRDRSQLSARMTFLLN